jgi:hypothetical protein
MAWAFAGRHSDRGRALRILFSDRHLHHHQHRAQPLVVDLSSVIIEKRCRAAQASRARSSYRAAAQMPALPAHEINARFGRRDRERRDLDRPGPRPARAGFAKAIRPHGRPDTLPLVRTILRNERGSCEIDNLFCRGLSMFSGQVPGWDRSCSSTG